MLTYIGISDDRPRSCCDDDGHVLASLLLMIREAKKRKQRGEIKKRAANHVVSVRLPDVAREGRKKSKIDCLLLSTLSAKLMDLDCDKCIQRRFFSLFLSAWRAGPAIGPFVMVSAPPRLVTRDDVGYAG